MTEQQKKMYYDMALRLCGIQCDKLMVELIYSVFEDVQKKGGEFTIRDFANIKAKVSEKHEKLSKKKKL